MVKTITVDLLRKRAEHNDGELSSLKEITLHQFDLQKIDVIQDVCRGLEIFLLQNNQIQKIENLSKLKSLRYLNMALNNIKRIENLQGCESLEKLDLTVNFVDDLFSVESLKSNTFLKELYLVGNPCTDEEGYRDFVVHTLPQLRILDGREITKSERIQASQNYPEIRQRLLEKYGLTEDDIEKRRKEEEERLRQEEATQKEEEDLETRRKKFQQEPVPHSVEARLQAARDMEAFHSEGRKEGDEDKPKEDEKKERKLVGSDGRILQCNEGKYPFKLNYTPNLVILSVEIPKFLDTSLIDVDVELTHIRVMIKKKLLQLTFDEMVDKERVSCERSRLSGQLVVTMVKKLSNLKGDVESIQRMEKEEEEKKKKIEQRQKEEQEAKEKETRAIANRMARMKLEVDEHGGNKVDWRNIVDDASFKNDERTGKKHNKGIVDKKVVKLDLDEDFVDNPDVPPLC